MSCSCNCWRLLPLLNFAKESCVFLCFKFSFDFSVFPVHEAVAESCYLGAWHNAFQPCHSFLLIPNEHLLPSVTLMVHSFSVVLGDFIKICDLYKLLPFFLSPRAIATGFPKRQRAFRAMRGFYFKPSPSQRKCI